MEEKQYRLKSLVVKAVENQMKDNEPPITNITFPYISCFSCIKAKACS